MMKKLFKRHAKKDEARVLISRTAGERVVYSIMFLIFALYAISIIYPLLYLVMNSLQDWLEFSKGTIDAFALPKPFHFENYKEAIFGMKMFNSLGEEIGMLQMFFNSIWFCVVTIAGGVLMSSFTGYAMAKYKFKLRSAIYAVAIFSMTIPIVGTTGSMFKLVSDLGIYNTPFYAILTSLGGFGFNFLVMYGFFSSISWSYAEAVFIDGGGHFTVFFRIMLPQARMAMLTLAIVAFIGHWNDYMTMLLYLPDYPTLASGLYQISRLFTRGGNIPAYYAGLVIATIPVIIIFACFQDTIMKNFSVGGLKG